MNEDLSQKLKNLPLSPGVYFHKAKSGEIIYVGKAAVLRNRVRQYFQKSRDMDIKTQALVAEIHDTDWIETDSEIDALFLESEMVKRYMPRFNILLRDDKSQIFIRIDMKSDWPTVSFTRNPADDKASYYGPYYNGFAVKKALRYLRRVFPYYTVAPKPGMRPDLDAHIGLSPAPGTTSKQYEASLRQLIRYIEGDSKTIAKELERDMNAAAKLHDFEQAAELRNKLRDLGELRRRIMFGDQEFLNISKDRALSDLTELLGLPKLPARIEGYDISHQSGTDVVASMVVFTNGVSDRAAYRKFKVREANDDVGNIYETLFRRLSDKNLKDWGVPELILIDGGKGQLDAALRALDDRGQAIPTVSVAKREEEIIVHGTRSHITLAIIIDLLRHPIPGVVVTPMGEYYAINLHAGVVNAGSHSRNLRGAPLTTRYSDVVKLIQRIRDESHRFAISYHSTLARTRATKSTLEDLAGIGPVTRRKLIRTFGSQRGVVAASQEELAAVIGQARAERLWRQLPR